MKGRRSKARLSRRYDATQCAGPNRAQRQSARACLLIPYAVVNEERCEYDATEVGQGVFVVSGGDTAPLLEPVEAALDGVAVAVQLGIEGRWPAAGAAPWPCGG